MRNPNIKIGLITSTPSEEPYLPIQLKLQKTAREQFQIPFDLFKNGEFCYFLDEGHPELYFKGERIVPEDYSLLLVRFAIKAAHTGDYYVVRAFQDKGVPVINPPDCLVKAKNKLESLRLLSLAGIPVTPTAVVRNREQIGKALSHLGEPPYIVKSCFGSKGCGVLEATSKAQVYAIFDCLWYNDRNEILLIQPYMGEKPAVDVRAFYMNYRPWRAMLRVAHGDEFRANIHVEAEGMPTTLSEEERKFCDLAVRTLGLPMAGLDFLRTAKGPVFLEINGCPGLQGITQSYAKAGIDLFPEFIELLLDLAKK